ncbi:hypothetical protein CRG98_020537 [Punica granatum]|uniref:DUF7745 domain-containing protein n=1 Tax=Punica granatum TaxID=22663 RepID=A0A2I0JS13_PUNGR|nr:hypothetical protein CRG98_020537 [Punica granatum]
MISGDSFSHACLSRVPSGRWNNPSSREISGRVHAGPDESTFVSVQLGDSTRDCNLVRMDRPHPYLRLDIIITPVADITCLRSSFRPVDRAFLRLIIGDLPLLVDSPIDWILLRTAISFCDTQRAVFRFQGMELAPTVKEYTTLIQRPMPTRDIACDAYHEFLLLIFGTIMFLYLSNLIDGALAQVILQVVGVHSYVEAVLAETIRSLDYVREARHGRMRGSPHLLQIWLLTHMWPFGSSHPFSCITDERSLIVRLLYVFQPSDRDYIDWIQFLEELTPGAFSSFQPESSNSSVAYKTFLQTRIALHTSSRGQTLQLHSRIGFYGFRKLDASYVAQFHPHGLAPVRRLHTPQIPHALQADIPDAESSVQGAMRTELQSIREERDQLRCELVDTRAELAYYRELESELAQTRARIASQDNEIARLSTMLDRVRAKAHKPTHNNYTQFTTGVASIPNSCAPKNGRRATRYLRAAYTNALPAQLPLPAQSLSNAIDPVCFTALKGMFNLLAVNMNTNMAELRTMLRDQNRASSSYTPPPECRTIVHPNPVASPIYITDSKDVSFSAMTYVPAVHPVSDPLPPQHAPTSMPLPPAAFLSMDSAMLILSPFTIPAQPPIYTVPPPPVPPVVLAQGSAPTADHFPFQALQPQMSFPYQAPPPLNIPHTKPGTPTQAVPIAPPTNIPPENEQERRMRRMEETIHALQADGKKLDMGIKLGRIEGSTSKREREASKKQTAGTSKRTKDAIVSAINPGHQPPQQFPVNYAPVPSAPQAYARPVHYAPPFQPQQAFYSTPLLIIQPQPPQQHASVQSRALASRPPQPAQRTPAPQAQQGNAAPSRQRKQFVPLPASLSHI